MGVVVKGQTVVAHVLGAVHGLGHGAHRQGFNEVGFWRSLDLGQQSVEAASNRLAAVHGEGIAKGPHKQAEVRQFGGVRVVVDAVDHGPAAGLLLPAPSHGLGHADVGQEHEFFDQFVRVLGHLQKGSNGLVLLVQLELDLGPVKGNGSVLHAPVPQGFGQRIEGVQGRRQGVCLALDDGLGLFVGQSALRMDHGAAKPAMHHFRLGRHLKNSRKSEFVFVRAQGAHLVAEHFGEHGNHPVHQVHRRSPFVGFALQSASRPDVMRDVGNVNAHFQVSVGQGLERQSVVKILGVDGVNGQGKDAAEIAPSGNFCRVQGLVQTGSVLLHLGRKFVGQSVLFQNGMDLGLVLAGAAQHLENLADGIELGVIPFHQLNHHHVSVVRLAQKFFGQIEIFSHPAVVCQQESMLGGNVYRTHVGGFGPFQNLHHLALLFGAGTGGRKKQDLHPVAVQPHAGVGVAHKNIFGKSRAGDVAGAGLGQVQLAFHKPFFKEQAKHIGRTLYGLLGADQ